MGCTVMMITGIWLAACASVGDKTHLSPNCRPCYIKSFVQSCVQIALGVSAAQRARLKEAVMPTLSVNPAAEIRGRSALSPLTRRRPAPLPPELRQHSSRPGTAALSPLRVPRTDTASTPDTAKRLSIRAPLLLWRKRYKLWEGSRTPLLLRGHLVAFQIADLNKKQKPKHKVKYSSDCFSTLKVVLQTIYSFIQECKIVLR